MADKKKVLMVFLDGVGIGKNDSEFNPFVQYGFTTFTKLFGAIPTLDNPILEAKNRLIMPVDACLGFPGLPQSGTGQATIYCGINAAEVVGKHFGPFAYSTLIPIIEQENIFASLQAKGKEIYFANAYPKPFFAYLKSGRKIFNVTAVMMMGGNLKFNKAEEVRKGQALTAEINNERWVSQLKYKLPIISFKQGARRLIRAATKRDFTLFEYFYTDYAGHFRYDGGAKQIIEHLDEFLYTLITELPKDMILMVVSDHGNFEDLSNKSHTMNPTLALFAGEGVNEYKNKVTSLVDYKSLIEEILC